MSDQGFSASVPFPMTLCHLSQARKADCSYCHDSRFTFEPFYLLAAERGQRAKISFVLGAISYSICSRERTVIMGLLNKVEVGHSKPAHLPVTFLELYCEIHYQLYS